MRRDLLLQSIRLHQDRVLLVTNVDHGLASLTRQSCSLDPAGLPPEAGGQAPPSEACWWPTDQTMPTLK